MVACRVLENRCVGWGERQRTPTTVPLDVGFAGLTPTYPDPDLDPHRLIASPERRCIQRLVSTACSRALGGAMRAGCRS